MPQYLNSREERISMLNRLASYYFGKAFRCSDLSQREDLFNQASACIRQADRQDFNDRSNWVCRGFLLLAKAQLESAIYYFNNTLEAEPDHPIALLGKACTLYHRKAYSDSLKIYAKLLRQNPACPANVRLGLALCHYKLDHKNQAYKAFERVIELDPNNSDAYVGLALLELEKGSYQKYLDLMVQAFKKDRANTLACLHISRHYFYKKDYERSIKLAEFCLNRVSESNRQLSDMNRLRAECYLTLAQCCHAQDDFENGFRHYTQACKLDSSLMLAQYGLGQMYLQQKDYNKALECFELVQTQAPNNYETLRILGSLYAKQHRKEQALEKLHQVVKINPNDYEAWIEIGQVLEISKPEKALEAYDKAIALMTDIPSELWNNVAVLRHKIGRQQEAQEAYEKITENKRSFLFNKARWHEDNGRFDEAETLYKKLLDENNKYTDAYVRLALLAKQKGDYVKALEYARTAIHSEQKPIIALCLKGALEAELGESVKALETFNRVIMEHSHHDLYALVAMGNLYYDLAIKSKEELHYEEKLKRSLQYFLKVLSLDEYNAYAASGVGMVLAELGDFKQAHETFRQVLDSKSDMNFLLVNEAHLQLLQYKTQSSLKLYTKARERNAITQDTLTLYQAMANFGSNKLEDCEELLKKLPQSGPNLYNLAITYHEHVLQTFKKPKRNVEETKQAIEKAEEAARLYELIVTKKWEVKGASEAREMEKKRHEIARRKAQEKLEPIRGLLEQCTRYLEIDLKAEAEQERLRIQQMMQLKEILAETSQEENLNKRPRVE